MNNGREPRYQALRYLSPLQLIKTLFPLCAVAMSVFLHFKLLPYQLFQMKPAQAVVPHVVVVGAGLAGLSASTEALNSGARVTLIDKETIGGNSAKATSGINAVLTPHQPAAGVTDDSIDLFIKDVIKSGQGRTDRLLAHVLASYSSEAVTFLEGILGQQLSNVAILGGHSRPRTHRLPTPPGGKPAPIGFTVINAFKGFLAQDKWKGKFELMERTNVTDLEFTDRVLPDGSSVRLVTAVKVSPSASTDSTETSLPLDALVLASGGFSADLGSTGLVSQYSEIAAKCPYTTNGKFATGDFLKVGQRLGFGTVDLDQIQLHPTGFVDPKSPFAVQKFLCPEVFRGAGALLFNARGQRFVNELATRDEVSRGINKFGNTTSGWDIASKETSINGDGDNRIAALIMNENVRSTVGQPPFDFYKSKGFIRELGQRKEAALKLGVDVDTFSYTLDSYNESARGESEDQFGKTTFPTVFAEDDVLYSAFVSPAVHYTMGGLKINTAGQIVQTNQQPVVNLFGAGEVTGGVHGANRLGGNGMLESTVFGRLAGKSAAALHMSEFASNPFKANQSITMTVSQFSPLPTTSDSSSSDFALLRLSHQSLYHKADLDLAQTVYLDTTTAAAPHSSPPVVVAATPAASSLGHIDFIVPVFTSDGLRDLNPGDKIQVRVSTDDTIAKLLMVKCDADGVASLAVHAASLAVNAAAQLAAFVENKKSHQLQITLICTPPINCTPLRNYLQQDRSNVQVKLVENPMQMDFSGYDTTTGDVNKKLRHLHVCWGSSKPTPEAPDEDL